MSKVRKAYTLRLAGRIVIFLCCLLLVLYHPGQLEILRGWNFFGRFSPLHILWTIWMMDMLFQLIPVKGVIALGSQKLFYKYFRPSQKAYDRQALKSYMAKAAKGAGRVFVLWSALTVFIGILHEKGILDDGLVFMASVAFYVCDLVCVVVICPFRLIMGNRCCTTCRIFNWDHLMMFAPMVYIDGFYPRSLFFAALAVWALWEAAVLKHPERFWEVSNKALQCSQCTDKLCPRYDRFVLKGRGKCDINL